MKRFKNLRLAKQYAAKTLQWVFDNKDGEGYVVVGSKMAGELIDAGLRPIWKPFDLIRS